MDYECIIRFCSPDNMLPPLQDDVEDKTSSPDDGDHVRICGTNMQEGESQNAEVVNCAAAQHVG
jgi:hypothetical protein